MFVTMHKSMRPVGRSRCRWGDNIAIDLKEGGRDGAQYIQVLCREGKSNPYCNPRVGFEAAAQRQTLICMKQNNSCRS